MEDSLKKRYSIKLFAGIISGVVGAILVAIVPKELGPIAYGQFVYLQDFYIKIIGFLDMGSSIAFFTKLSARHTRKELITFYFLYSFAVFLLLLFFIFCVDSFDYSSDIFPDIPNKYIYMGLFFGFFTWFTQIFIKISDAYALTVSIELIKIGHKIVSLLLLLYFIYMAVFDLNAYFSFHYIALISFFIITSLIFIKKGIFEKKIFHIKKLKCNPLIREFINYCHPLFIYNIVVVAVGVFDIWLLQFTAGSEQTGFYGLAYSLAGMCFLFTRAMTPIITREFAKSYEKKDLEQIRKLFYRYIPMLYSLAAFFSVFVSLQSSNVLEIFTDGQFRDASFVLSIMAFYPIHQTYGQLSGSIFYATGQTKLMRNITLLTQPIGIIISVVLIYFLDLGAVGLAFKMLIGQFIGVLIQLYFNSKFLNLNLKYFILHQVYSILFFSIIVFCASFISLTSVFLEFFVTGIFYTFLVIMGVYIFPQIFSTTRSEIKVNIIKLCKMIKC